MSTEVAAPRVTGADVLLATVAELSGRAPAIVAAASAELGHVVLALHFGDGSTAQLAAARGHLVATAGTPRAPDVDVWFDARAMNLVFDLANRPVDEVMPEQPRRARRPRRRARRVADPAPARPAGLGAACRAGDLAAATDARTPTSGAAAEPAPASNAPRTDGLPSPRGTGWTALDFLDDRMPSDPRDGLVDGTVTDHPRVLWDGRASRGWWETERVWDADLLTIMRRCRDRVADEMDRLIPDRSPKTSLYDLMRAYPARQGKGLRPTLTIAACAAFGGRPEDAVRVAAALELFHNGFLVHDDIADESTHRRGQAHPARTARGRAWRSTPATA